MTSQSSVKYTAVPTSDAMANQASDDFIEPGTEGLSPAGSSPLSMPAQMMDKRGPQAAREPPSMEPPPSYDQTVGSARRSTPLSKPRPKDRDRGCCNIRSKGGCCNIRSDNGCCNIRSDNGCCNIRSNGGCMNIQSEDGCCNIHSSGGACNIHSSSGCCSVHDKGCFNCVVM